MCCTCGLESPYHGFADDQQMEVLQLSTCTACMCVSCHFSSCRCCIPQLAGASIATLRSLGAIVAWHNLYAYAGT